MDFGNLNDKQIEAVKNIEGPQLILAGAGSGKTSTMTYRIAYLLENGRDEQGRAIGPWNILAVTFTNKAANEMRERVERLVGSTNGMWIMTFHGMCLRMLRDHAELMGYDKDFVIYDTTDQKTIVRNIIKDLNLDPREFKVPYILAVIGDKKEKGITPSRFEAAADGDWKQKALATAYYSYEKKLKENNAMDFDDLLLNALKLLKGNEEVLLEYQNKFRYIMVDEYQDTNRIQYELVYLLAEKHRNLCVVGDDDQCIYQWRGADIRNILDFENDFPNAKVVKLEQNYRSKANILSAAHSVIHNNKGRKSKKLWTEADKGEKITYYRAEDEKDEAGYVAGQILALMEKGKKYSDFAILYRTNAQSRQFEEAFTRYDIPYRVLSGLRYYDRKEIKDIMSYMRLVVNPKDEVSFRRVINEPKRGMGEKTLDKIGALAEIRNVSMLEALMDPDILGSLPNRSYEQVKSMVELLTWLRDSDLKVSEIYDSLMVKTGYLGALEQEGTVESEGRIENLMEFKTVIQDYEKEDPDPSLSGFLEKLSLMSDIDNHDESLDTVVLMTMHSAKGLEFPVVFLPGMEDGLFPGYRSFDSEESIEEERRLCYVGMTRAKERLFLTGASLRTLYGRTEYTRESQFLREVDGSLLQGDSVFKRRDDFGIGRVPGPGVATGAPYGASSDALSGYKPYDVLKEAKEATKKSAFLAGRKGADAESGSSFEIGDKVSHPKFGEGVVVDTSISSVTVDFGEEGTKKLAKGIAPIKKI